jgi:hypothetical protein
MVRGVRKLFPDRLNPVAGTGFVARREGGRDEARPFLAPLDPAPPGERTQRLGQTDLLRRIVERFASLRNRTTGGQREAAPGRPG